MDANRWKQVEKLFQSALEREPTARAAFLSAACAGDEPLRREVESLLACQPAAHGALEAAVDEALEGLAESSNGADVSGQQLGFYRMLEKIGAGGMGEVYLAVDARLGRRVALKLLPAHATHNRDRVRRFAQEARAASALNHPNIITIFDIGQLEATHFIATEFVDGQTLRQRMKQARLTLIEALDIAAQIANALAAAHEAGIIHRDIKPENIMLRRDGFVKVLDFGLARMTEQPNVLAGAADFSVASTEPGVVMGTVAYMSPEQARGLEVDARTDLFSLGVVLYEMLTGRRPFTGPSNADVLSAILSAAPKPLMAWRADLPGELDLIVNRALSKDPDARYPSAQAMLAELKRAQRQAELQAEQLDTMAAHKSDKIETAPTIVMETAQTDAPATHGGEVAHTASTRAVLLNEAKRHKLGLSATLVLLLAAVGGWFAWRNYQLNQAKSALPRIEELAQSQRFFEAYDLALNTQRYLPNDPTIARLMRTVADDLSVTTEPPGAQVYLTRFDSSTRQLIGATPVKNRQIARGAYLLHIEKPGYATLERTIAGTVINEENLLTVSPPLRLDEKLAAADKVPARMTFVPGGAYRLVAWRRPTEARVALGDYFIDKYEVSNREYKEFIDAGGYLKQEFWRHPFIKDGRTLSWEEALREFKDRTGLPGPRNWAGQNFPAAEADHPVTGVTWYEAAAYATFRGKQLPTVFQWEKAARNGATTFAGTMMPWGLLQGPVTQRANFKSNGPLPVESLPFGMSPFGCHHIAGNVAEWLLNETTEGFIASGGSWDDLYYLFGYHGDYPGFHSSNKLGFRCVRNVAAADQSVMRLATEAATPTYQPVSDAAFNELLGHYRYEKTPLDAQVAEAVDTAEWRREKLVYNGAEGDRASAYLYLPRNYPPPFQVIHLMPPSGVEFGAYSVAEFIESFLAPHIKAGRAVFGVVLKGYPERKWPPNHTRPSVASAEFREQVVNTLTDLRRGLDVLETRNDIDAAKLAYLGYSTGGYKLLPPAVDARYRAVLLSGAAIDETLTRWNAATNPINFLPHIRAPKLMLHGRYDEAATLKTEAMPLYQLMRPPKRLELFDGGHIPSLEVRTPIINAWLDETLGPVKHR